MKTHRDPIKFKPSDLIIPLPQKEYIIMPQQQSKQGPLDKVCIMQKYNDSEKVLECREEFNKAEKYIIKAVNEREKLIKALKQASEFIEALTGHVPSVIKTALSNAQKE